MRFLALLLTATLSLIATTTTAAPRVQVVGLFPGAAVLNVDGQRKLVRVGQTGPGGVVVVSADSRGAVLRVEGVERSYGLSREFSSGFAEPERKQLSIAKGQGGHYWIAGSINGQSVQFLVDTGATSVAPPASSLQPPASSLQPPASSLQPPASSLQPPASFPLLEFLRCLSCSSPLPNCRRRSVCSPCMVFSTRTPARSMSY